MFKHRVGLLSALLGATAMCTLPVAGAPQEILAKTASEYTPPMQGYHKSKRKRSRFEVRGW